MAKRIDKPNTFINPKNISGLFKSISDLIEQSKKNVALHINSEMVIVNWRIGAMINENILKNKRAEYGKAVISNLSKLLTSKYGSGYSIAHVTYCRTFATTYPDERIIHALREQLSWTHIRIILAIGVRKISFPKIQPVDLFFLIFKWINPKIIVLFFLISCFCLKRIIN